MRRRQLCLGLAVLVCAALVLTMTSPAFGWIENHVLGDEVRIEVEPSGKATVEHRLTLKTNGNVRLRKYRIVGVDRDAVPLPNSYAVPARDALSSSLASAVPVSMAVVHPKKRDGHATAPPAALDVSVDDRKGLRRGTYVFVLRYRTDLRARGLVQRDGAMVRVVWHGPRFEDGFDNARATFVVPAAPSAPRAATEEPDADVEGDATLAATYLSEVRRGGEHDEIELLRTYAPRGESVLWAVRVDRRAIEAPAQTEDAVTDVPAPRPASDELAPRDVLMVAAAGLLLLVWLLVWLRGCEVARVADQADADVPSVVPLPAWLRGPMAGVAFTGGVALQLLTFRPVLGACCVVLACLLAAHGVARPRVDATRRGPGRWLTVTEREAHGRMPSPRGARLDVSTRIGKVLLLLLLGAWGAGVYWLSLRSLSWALLAGFDAVLWLAIFGTGCMAALPPDMAVEPARFLRKLMVKLRSKRGLDGLRLARRIRIPNDAVDPDELRLLVVPRLPRRGFTAIEVGLTYALGFGARVAMPEILLRVVKGSPCDEAVMAVSKKARVTPGRKPDERVIAFSPRLPTVRMTVELTAALAMRVADHAAVAAKSTPSSPESGGASTGDDQSASNKPKRRSAKKGIAA